MWVVGLDLCVVGSRVFREIRVADFAVRWREEMAWIGEEIPGSRSLCTHCDTRVASELAVLRPAGLDWLE
jgi:hypothetical protein